MPWFARIPQRIGYRGESRYWLINDMRPFDRRRLDQTVKRFVALGRESQDSLAGIPHPALSVSEENQRRVLESLKISPERPVVAWRCRMELNSSMKVS